LPLPHRWMIWKFSRSSGSAPRTASLTATEPRLPAVSGASTVYLYNFESDRVLLKQVGQPMIAPASTVKIMTGLLGIELLKDRMEEYIVITSDMLSESQGYTIQLQPNTAIRVRDLLYGVICGGGNDAANVLAHVCCGSIDAFVLKMNQKAKEWGCTNTHYTNPTGIDASGMSTTLDDTVILAKKAIETPLFLEMSAAANHSFSLQNEASVQTIYNRNALISSFSAIGYQNKYATGLNAGMTERGGYCVVTYASNENTSYLCIVMGATENAQGIRSYGIANQLLYYVFSNYSYTQIHEQGSSGCRVPVNLALPNGTDSTATVSCVLADDLFGYLPNNINIEKDLEYRYYLHHPALTAPVKSGTVVGGVDVFWNDELIAHGKLIAAEDVSPSDILFSLDTMKRVILSRFTVVFLLSFLVLCLCYFGILHRKKKKKRTIVTRIP